MSWRAGLFLLNRNTVFNDDILQKVWSEITVTEIFETRRKAKAQNARAFGHIYPVPQITAEVRACLSKLAEMFQKIDQDGYVRLSRWNQLEIARCLWRYLEPRTSKYQPYQPLLQQLNNHLLAAANIASEISKLPICSDDEDLYLCGIAEMQDELRDHARFVRHGLLKKRGVGAPSRKAKRLIVVNELARIYRSAGGRVTAAWDDDGKSIKGDFANFLVKVWEVLPPRARPPTSVTFTRLAREVDPKLKGQENTVSAT